MKKKITDKEYKQNKTKSSHNYYYANSTKTKSFFITLVFLVFLLTALALLSNVSNFYLGYHNIDLGANLKFINAKFDLGLIDIGSDYIARTSDQLIIEGFNQIKNSFLMAIIFAFCLGFILCLIIFLKRAPKHL